MIDDGIPLQTRRRSPTLNAAYDSHYLSSLFIFSDEVKQELKTFPKNSTILSADDMDADPGISGRRIRCHKRVPTAPNFSFLTNFQGNVPIIRRPIKPLSPNIYQPSPIINAKEFVVIPKTSNFQIDPPEEFQVFSELVNDLDITLNPRELGFIPTAYWPEGPFLLRDLISDYFQQPCGPETRFSHKLFNALQKVLKDPFYSTFFGVEWLNETVLLVVGPLFGFILGMENFETELFGPIGQLALHGFIELNETQALTCVDSSQLENVDFISTKLFLHNAGIFTKSSTQEDIISARWSRKRYRSSSLTDI